MHIQLGDISGDGMPNIACVTFGSDGIAYAFKSFSPAPNLPPYTPSNPSPPDGATDVPIGADLNWTGGDPDGDPVTYDVYFGTISPPPQVAWNHTITTYDPGTLDTLTTYYWQIIAWDNYGASTPGPIWQFTTEDAIPDLEIESITGGFGVAAKITNIGDGDANTVNVNIKLEGGLILFGGDTTKNIGNLAANGSAGTARSIPIGIGPTTINVTVTCDEGAEATKTASAFVLLFLVLGVS